MTFDEYYSVLREVQVCEQLARSRLIKLERPPVELVTSLLRVRGPELRPVAKLWGSRDVWGAKPRPLASPTATNWICAKLLRTFWVHPVFFDHEAPGC